MRNNRLGSYKMRGVVELLRLYRSKSSGDHVANVVGATGDLNAFDGGRNSMDQLAGVRFLHALRRRGAENGVMGGSGNDGLPKPPSPTPSSPSSRRASRFPIWAKLVLGSVFSLLLAFWTPNWATLLKIEGEAEVAMKEAEQVAEMVEKVATVVEKVSEEVATQLPTDNKFKEAALIVEHVSKEAAKDAHIAEQIIHKMDEMKQDLDDVKKIVEPVIEKFVDDDKSKKSAND